MKLETIRQIVAIQLDAFCSKLNAMKGPKKKTLTTPKIIPTTHSNELSLMLYKLEKIGANMASATANILLKIIKKVLIPLFQK